MDYRESLDYLYGLQRFGIKLGLENIRALLRRLGHPELALPLVHVAGSNGKGSVCAALAEILRQTGVRTGLYTSPHLHSFTERIRIDGRPIAEADVARLTDEVRALAGDLPLTFFEFTTALALRHFQQERVEAAVLEVGLGGRLDATNAVTPRLSIVTPICRDHTEHLGADLAAIAGEKAGIIKPGVPVVLAPQPPAAGAVLEEAARRRRSPLWQCGRDFRPLAGDGETFSYQGIDLELDRLRPGLAGRHQFDNLAVALAAAELLRRQGFPLDPAALRRGVEQVLWPGRLEWWQGGREVLLDGAHNEGGMAVLADYLAAAAPAGVHWVVGIKGERPAEAMLAPLLPYCRALYCTAPPVEKAVPPERLAAAGRSAGVPAAVFAAPADALTAARAARRPREIVLVAGSLFLVAAAREALAGGGR